LHLVGLALLATLAAGTVQAKPAGWRLIWTGDPSTTATLSWNTDKNTSVNRVRIWTGDVAAAKTVDCKSNGKYSLGDFDLYYHHAALTGLSPATLYRVEMESDGDKSATFHFRTAPKTDRPLSILFGGDSRSDRRARQQVNRTIADMYGRAALSASLMQQEAKANEILALAHGGDYIVSGTDLGQWAAWMIDHQLTTSSEGRLLPIIPARGNHDVGPIFNEVFALPAGDKNYYSVRIGPNVALLTLNTDTTMAGDQSRWLADALKPAREECRWVVAQYHRPAFPAVKRPSGARQHFVPLFERFNVDLVMEADGHVMKRTFPIRNEQRDETGVVYIGEGGLGVKQRTPRTNEFYLKPPTKLGSGHHVQKITFTDGEMKIQTIVIDVDHPTEKATTVFDRYTRKAR
jgi:hypothetical protein